MGKVTPNNDRLIRRLETTILRLQRQLSIATNAIDIAKRLRYENGRAVEYRDHIRAEMEKAQAQLLKLETNTTENGKAEQD